MKDMMLLGICHVKDMKYKDNNYDLNDKFWPNQEKDVFDNFSKI